MHVIFVTRGLKQQRDVMIMMLQSQMWKWKRKNLKTKKDEFVQVQGNLQPMELWSYNIPSECYDEFMTLLNTTDYLGKIPEAALRKALGHGVKKMPEWKKVPTNKFLERRGVAVYPIGIKEDIRKECDWGYEQEML